MSIAALAGWMYLGLFYDGRLTKRLVTIVVGQRADLMSVNENRLENLTPLAMPDGVIARGWFSRETLQQALEARRPER